MRNSNAAWKFAWGNLEKDFFRLEGTLITILNLKKYLMKGSSSTQCLWR